MTTLQSFVFLAMAQGMRPQDILLEAECEHGATRDETLALIQSHTEDV